LFDVSPSIKSWVQWNKYLRFGYTQKFYREKQRYAHCRETEHEVSVCELGDSALKCIFCQQQHTAKDHRRKECLSHKEIKKIIASEKVPFKEAVQIQKTGAVNTAFSFADKAANKSRIDNIVKGHNTLNSTNKVDISSFFQLAARVFSKENPKKWPSSTSFNQSPQLPHVPNFSLPSGSFLDYVSQNNNNDITNSNWISNLASSLTHTLMNSFDNIAISLSSLSALIESLFINLLSSSKAVDDDTF